MSDSTGNGFPTTNLNVGHIFYDVSERSLWKYIGGDPKLDSSWVLISGVFIDQPDTSLWGEGQIGALWYSLSSGGFNTWDGSSIVPVGSGSGYKVLQENGVNIASRDTLDIVGRGFKLLDTGLKSKLSLLDVSSMCFDYDDFVSGGFNMFQSSGGKLGWFLNSVGSGGFDNTQEIGHPGIMVLLTGTTINSKAFMYIPGTSSNPGSIVFGDNFNVRFLISFSGVGSDVQFRVGLTTNVATFGGGVFIEKLFSDTDVFAVSSDGISILRQMLFTPTANIWYFIGIRKSEGDVVFSVNGNDIVTMNTNLPLDSAALASVVSIENNAAVDRRLFIDYYDIFVTLLSR
jgi:hypothetical protein